MGATPSSLTLYCHNAGDVLLRRSGEDLADSGSFLAARQNFQNGVRRVQQILRLALRQLCLGMILAPLEFDINVTSSPAWASG
jgi:hypothetical protein